MHFYRNQPLETSILTNSINRKDPDEARDWAKILVESANLKKDELEDEVQKVINELAERARKKLQENDVGNTPTGKCRVERHLWHL